MRWAAFAVLLCFAGLVSALIPSWVQPGVTVVYDGVGSGIQNGQPVNGVQTLITMRVTSVSGNTVAGTYNVINPTIDPSIWQLNGQWSCIDGQACDWRFWVDPTNPAASVKGPHGEPYTEGGPVSYSSPLGGPVLDGTHVLYYQNADTHVEYHLTYQARTGLIAAYAEIYPSQLTYLYFRSISADLSGYQPPSQPPAQPAGPTGGGLPCAGGLILMGTLLFAAFGKR